MRTTPLSTAPRILRAATLLVVVLTASMIGSASPAAACSCAPPAPAETAAQEADAVFVGTVTDLTPAGGGVVAHVSVETVHEGEVAAEVEVHTASDSAACGYPFEVGREELVYAVLDADGRLLTNLCDRTAPVADAGGDLSALGDGQAPEAAAAPRAESGGWLLPGGIVLLVVAAATATVAARRRRTDDS